MYIKICAHSRMMGYWDRITPGSLAYTGRRYDICNMHYIDLAQEREPEKKKQNHLKRANATAMFTYLVFVSLVAGSVAGSFGACPSF